MKRLKLVYVRDGKVEESYDLLPNRSINEIRGLMVDEHTEVEIRCSRCRHTEAVQKAKLANAKLLSKDDIAMYWEAHQAFNNTLDWLRKNGLKYRNSNCQAIYPMQNIYEGFWCEEPVLEEHNTQYPKYYVIKMYDGWCELHHNWERTTNLCRLVHIHIH